MSRQRIVVRWESIEDKASVVEGLQSRGYVVSPDGGGTEVSVLDVRSFHNIKSAMASYHESALPSLIVVESHEQETSVLSQLSPGDDLCLAAMLDVQGAVRLTRVLERDAVPRLEGGQAGAAPASFLDPLTGLENRHAFYLHLFDNIRECGPEAPLSLVMLDLDHFKKVNDQLGHAAGDHILSSVGETLRRVGRGASGIARVGGNVFAVALRSDQTQATRLADFIRSEIAEQPFTAAETPVSVTVSMGVATSVGNFSGEELMAESDKCLYAAKAAGRNRVVSSDGFAKGNDETATDPVVEDFENRVRVLTERLIRNVADRGKSMAAHLREEADHDGLTGLYIRRYFDRRMGREFQKSLRDARALSLIFLDIDHFGQVNKTHGFPTGDRALRYVAGVLKDSVRVIDWVARYGGEELCVVLPDTTLDEAVFIAERIRARIESGIVTAYDGTQFSLTASLGVGIRQDSDAAVVDFVQRVSDKTREAKAAGRNVVRS